MFVAVDPDCGEGWVTPIVFGEDVTQQNFCYQLNRELRVWAEASADCKRKGGQLTSIGSPYEQTNIESMIVLFHYSHLQCVLFALAVCVIHICPVVWVIYIHHMCFSHLQCLSR